MANGIRILGLDPGLRRTGWGVIAVEGSRLVHVAHGVICPPDKADLSERLLAIFEGVCAIVAEHAPHEAAIEETFATANGQSTLKLGQARAAAMLAPARAGLLVGEYAATVVKKAVVGTGGADNLNGGDGTDLLDGGSGSDTIAAGAGDDEVRALDGVLDVIDGQAGNDTAERDNLVDQLTSIETIL